MTCGPGASARAACPPPAALAAAGTKTLIIRIATEAVSTRLGPILRTDRRIQDCSIAPPLPVLTGDASIRCDRDLGVPGGLPLGAFLEARRFLEGLAC